RCPMPITFSSKYSPDVLMLGDIASVLLKAMGQSEMPPGALQGENIKAAADRLRQHLRALPDTDQQVVADDEDDDAQADEQEERPVGLSIRARPLLDMLDKAYKEKEDVMWR